MKSKVEQGNGKQNRVFNLFANKLAAFAGLILLCVFFSIASPNFLTVNNLLIIALQIAVIATISIGQTFTMITAGIDLSVGSVLGLSGVVAAEAMVSGVPIWFSVILGIGTGVICGLVNGVIISLGNIPPFIATLGMLQIARGIALVITEGTPVSGLPESFEVIGRTKVFDVIPVPVIIMIIAAIIMGVILKKTLFGRNVYAIGSNETAAILSGIKVKWNKIMVYAVSGLMAGIAGVIMTSRLVSAQPTAGELFELQSIAAVVIGGASLMGGVGTILGSIIGAFVIGVLRNGLDLLHVSAFWQQVAIGSVIIIAVYIDTLRKKKS